MSQRGWFLLNIQKGGRMLLEVHTTKGEGIYPLLSLTLSLAFCMSKKLDEETDSVGFSLLECIFSVYSGRNGSFRISI